MIRRRTQEAIAIAAVLSGIAALVLLIRHRGDRAEQVSSRTPLPQEGEHMPAPSSGSRGSRFGRGEVSDPRLSAVTNAYDEAEFTGSKPKKRYELPVEEFDRYEYLTGFTNSMGSMDEWGCKLTSCRAQHQRAAFAAGKCNFNTKTYIQETDDGASVTRVDFRLENADGESPDCFRYIECLKGAWLGRPAELPAGESSLVVDDYVYAPRFDGHGGDMGEMTDDEFEEAYERLYDRTAQDLENRRRFYDENKDDPKFGQNWHVSMREGLIKEKREMEDNQAMVATLRGGYQQCVEVGRVD